MSMSVDKPNISDYMLVNSFNTHSREMTSSEDRFHLSHRNGKSPVVPMQTGEVIDVEQYSHQNLVDSDSASIHFNSNTSNSSVKQQLSQKSFLKPATPIGNYGSQAAVLDQSSQGMESSKVLFYFQFPICLILFGPRTCLNHKKFQLLVIALKLIQEILFCFFSSFRICHIFPNLQQLLHCQIAILLFGLLLQQMQEGLSQL